MLGWCGLLGFFGFGFFFFWGSSDGICFLDFEEVVFLILVILYPKFPLNCGLFFCFVFFLLYSGNSELFSPAEFTALAKQPKRIYQKGSMLDYI